MISGRIVFNCFEIHLIKNCTKLFGQDSVTSRSWTILDTNAISLWFASPNSDPSLGQRRTWDAIHRNCDSRKQCPWKASHVCVQMTIETQKMNSCVSIKLHSAHFGMLKSIKPFSTCVYHQRCINIFLLDMRYIFTLTLIPGDWRTQLFIFFVLRG